MPPADPANSRLRHDLRNAVGQVIGFTELLIEDAEDGGHGVLVPDLEKVRAAGHRALALIEEHLPSASGAASLVLHAPPSAAPAFPTPAPAPTPGGRVLVVDDNDDNRALLARRLESQSFSCRAAADGPAALAALSAADPPPFDVVLLDVMMPGMDGYEVLRRIKADPALSLLPVLMISAVEEIDSVVRCLELGAADYLPKPFNPVLLRARVGASVREKRLRDREQDLLREVQGRLERERRITDTLQRALIHDIDEHAFPALTVASRYEAAWSEAEVGGDLFDAFALPDGRVALAVADASGKGLEAAARVGQVKYALRAYARESDGDPAAILARLNDLLCDAAGGAPGDGFGGSFVALSLAVYDPATGAAALATAGSEPPLILRCGDGTSRTTEAVEGGGAPLGILPGADYAATAHTLVPGDVLLLYTDGLTEARQGRGALLGPEGLAALALGASCPDWSGDQRALGSALLEGARAFGGGTLRDDACLLLARREK
jgi:sigma-B regulation protein RsbU (phosphoserine phosphatase)